MTDREAKLKTIDAALSHGIADAEAGRVVPIGEAFARVRAELESGEVFGPMSFNTQNENEIRMAKFLSRR